MKNLEVKILMNDYKCREGIVHALAKAGYKVRVEIRKEYPKPTEYYVVFGVADLPV